MSSPVKRASIGPEGVLPDDEAAQGDAETAWIAGRGRSSWHGRSGDDADGGVRVRQGTKMKVPAVRVVASRRWPLSSRCRSGSSVSVRPGRGRAWSSRRFQAASHDRATGPAPARRAALAAWSHPAVGLAEQPAVTVVAVALGRRAVGDQHIKGIEFDVVEFDFAFVVVPQDGTVVDQEFGRDQHAVDEQRMALGEAQILGVGMLSPKAPCGR